MQRILVATDFSTRSERALRRAVMLARQLCAPLDLVHVVDDDQPRKLLDARRDAASGFLEQMALGVRKKNGIHCDPRIILGEAFDAIIRVSEELSSDLIVIGAHRRQILRDVFIGTTAERIIRSGSRPVLMVNAVAAGPYSRILAPIDLAASSAAAMDAMQTLGLARGAAVDALHLFEPIAAEKMDRAALPPAEKKAYLTAEQAQGEQRLREILAGAGVNPDRCIVRPRESRIVEQICDVAKETKADLIVMGTRGRTGLARMVLGSVAEEVLRQSDRDVLAVPPQKSDS